MTLTTPPSQTASELHEHVERAPPRLQPCALRKTSPSPSSHGTLTSACSWPQHAGVPLWRPSRASARGRIDAQTYDKPIKIHQSHIVIRLENFTKSHDCRMRESVDPLRSVGEIHYDSAEGSDIEVSAVNGAFTSITETPSQGMSGIHLKTWAGLSYELCAIYHNPLRLVVPSPPFLPV